MLRNSRIGQFFLFVFIYFKGKSSHYRIKIIKSLKDLKVALAQETVETKEMLEVYSRFTRGKATQEEMNTANKQFRDLLKSLGLGVFAVLPFAPVTIPLLIRIGRKFGIELLPTSFKKKKD